MALVEDSNNFHVSTSLNINRKTVIKWKHRWIQSKVELDRIEKDEPRKLNQAIKEILEDSYRFGRPNSFTMEQIANIINLSLLL